MTTTKKPITATTKHTTTTKPVVTTLPPRRNPATGLLQPFDVSEVILNANNELNFPANGFLGSTAEGIGMHKINIEQALLYAPLFKSNAARTGIPLAYALAAVSVESCFDPNAFDKNLTGSNRENNHAKYDIGIAQLNLRYLIDAQVPVRATLLLAETFAHTPEEAIPYFFDQQKLLIEYAKSLTFSSSADKRSVNIYFVASTMYNMGRTGGYDAFQHNTVNNHAHDVALLEVKYAQYLGEHSVMQEVLK